MPRLCVSDIGADMLVRILPVASAAHRAGSAGRSRNIVQHVEKGRGEP